jgi:hypothetical protein
MINKHVAIALVQAFAVGLVAESTSIGIGKKILLS